MLPDVSNEKHLVLGTDPAKEVPHLLGRCKRGFIDHVKMLHCRVGVSATGKEALQGFGMDTRVAELPGGARGRGEALDQVAIPLRSFTHLCQTGGLADARATLQSMDLVARRKYLFDGA